MTRPDVQRVHKDRIEDAVSREGSVTPEPIVDIGVFDELARFSKPGANLVDRVIEAFLESSQNLAGQLCEAIEANECESAALAAHTLKSGSAQVGGLKLKGLLEKLELEVRAGNIAEARVLHRDFERVYAELLKALATMQTGD